MTPDQPSHPVRDEGELFRLLVENVEDYALFIDPVDCGFELPSALKPLLPR